MLKDPKIRATVTRKLIKALNTNKIPDYFKLARMILLSKRNSAEASLDDTRPIMIMSHLTKIFEKCIKNKREELGSRV